MQNWGLGCSIAPLFWSPEEPTSHPSGVTLAKMPTRVFPSGCLARNSTLFSNGLLINAAPENTNKEEQGGRRGRKDGYFPFFKPGVMVAAQCYHLCLAWQAGSGEKIKSKWKSKGLRYWNSSVLPQAVTLAPRITQTDRNTLCKAKRNSSRSPEVCFSWNLIGLQVTHNLNSPACSSENNIK